MTSCNPMAALMFIAKALIFFKDFGLRVKILNVRHMLCLGFENIKKIYNSTLRKIIAIIDLPYLFS